MARFASMPRRCMPALAGEGAHRVTRRPLLAGFQKFWIGKAIDLFARQLR